MGTLASTIELASRFVVLKASVALQENFFYSLLTFLTFWTILVTTYFFRGILIPPLFFLEKGRPSTSRLTVRWQSNLSLAVVVQHIN